ncbi:hypothetical protein L5515_014839 [Caenorhabditis briggsae]|uniref:Peptidase S1 domain-containing protein n=1 Tax=Caenorhabditis briggsae TaxID=6238 RepID=A0AAE9J8J2_CAEBR|nr:hypothetical protein L5515_014839 [Caenorhabditis briggsae]
MSFEKKSCLRTTNSLRPYCRLVVFIVIIGTVSAINEKEYTLDDECGQHSTNLELAQVRSAQEPADYVGSICDTEEKNAFVEIQTLDHRLIGGSETRPHAWPWTVQLLSRLGQHRCGGSLIDPNFVLTAAHCFAKDRRRTSYSVRVGGHRSGSGSPHRVTAVSIHPWYNIGFPSSYDFAIMRYEGLQGFSLVGDLHLRAALHLHQHCERFMFPSYPLSSAAVFRTT